jgi:Icc protein
MLIAQLSDLHICRANDSVFGGVDSAQSLIQCVQAVNALRPQPDFVVLSGDLVNTGHPDEYIRLQSILKRLNARYYLMPGNHDDRAALRSAFDAHTYLGSDGPVQYVIEQAHWRVLALDTIVPGAEHGELDAPRLTWLETALMAHAQRPTIIFMHHPAYATGIVEMDGGRVHAPAFWSLLARHRQIKLVSCGHVHRAIFAQHETVPVCVAPSTAAHLSLQLDSSTRLGVTNEPVGFLLHHSVDEELRTHCVWVPTRLP